MKQNKGFTLIELLAVIVILAVIALIATPMILGVIESSKKASVERSVDYFVQAVELKNTELLIIGEGHVDGIYQKDTLGIIDVKGTYPTDLCLQVKNGNVLHGEFEFDGQVLAYDNGTITHVDHSVTCPYPIEGMLVGFEANQLSKNDTVSDYSGNGAHGRLKNITKDDFQDGILTFNGINQGMEFPLENYDFKTELTLITRVRFDQNSNVNQDFFGNWESAGFGLSFLKEGNLLGEVYIDNSYLQIVSPQSFSLNTWYTVALVYNGTQLKLFIDDTLVTSMPVSGAIKPSVTPVVFGYNPNGPNDIYLPSHVSVKNAFVYTKALTDDEIKAHYQLDLEKNS